MTNQHKDISANIGKTYDNLCQLIGENYTGNPEQVLKVCFSSEAYLIKPYEAIYSEILYPDTFRFSAKRINSLTMDKPCTLLEDLTPVPKNPNVIETVEELYERVKEASDSKIKLGLKSANGDGKDYTYIITRDDGYVCIGDVGRFEVAIKLGLKVEVVE